MEVSRISIMNIIKTLNLPLIFRVIIGVTFIYASYSKILDPQAFSDNIHNYHITPVEVENLAALIIPWIELIVGVFLILGVFLEGATSITIGLLIFFIFILSQAVIRGIDVHCGCFKTEADIGVTDLRFELIKRIIEDFILLGMAFVVKMRNKFTLSRVALNNQSNSSDSLAGAISREITGSSDSHMLDAAYIRHGVINEPNLTISDNASHTRRLTFGSLLAGKASTFNKFSKKSKI